MTMNILHIYRNTPLGRETLRQAADFTRKIHGKLQVYIPQYDRFLFYFEREAVEIRLDQSYLYLPDTAEHNVRQIVEPFEIPFSFVKIASKTASSLPNLPTNFDLLSLPRIMVERQGRMQLSAIGAGIRQIVKSTPTPALLSPGRFHDWQEILVLFGGSDFSISALKWALLISRHANLAVNMLTLLEEGRELSDYERILEEQQIDRAGIGQWNCLPAGSVVTLLEAIPRDALIAMGAYGHGRVLEKLFGSTTELIQKNTANLLMLVGENGLSPKYRS
ncbi:MAG: universal stress protein [bacterium]